MSDARIKVMVVEDSAYMRYVISELLESDPDIQVVEKARDGLDALERLRENIPDVITLDIQMPRMDGLQFLQELKKDFRIPTIMFSSLTTEGAEDTIKALGLGAFDFVPKPTGMSGLSLDDVREFIIAKVKAAAAHMPAMKLTPETAAAEKAVETAAAEAAETKAVATVKTEKAKRRTAADKSVELKKVVAIACSTGGPRALTEIIPLLPKDLPACVVVVQHMPPKFTTSLAVRLDSISAVEVREAANGDRLIPGVVYIAPGDYHIQAGKGDVLYLSQEPPQHGVRPSANILMKSVAKMYGSMAIGVVLTGMGVDGRDGILDIKDTGGQTICEAEESCVVFGMPRAAIETGKVDFVVPLNSMADEIINVVFS